MSNKFYFSQNVEPMKLFGRSAPRSISITLFCLSMITLVAMEWINDFFDVLYFRKILDSAEAENDPDIKQSWIDQKILNGIATPIGVYRGLGIIIIAAIIKNVCMFFLFKDRIRTDKNDLAEAILKIIVRAVTILIDDGFTLFFQYFYFEMYNDIEMAKHLTDMVLGLLSPTRIQKFLGV